MLKCLITALDLHRAVDTAQKMKFPLRISSVNVTKSAVA